MSAMLVNEKVSVILVSVKASVKAGVAVRAGVAVKAGVVVKAMAMVARVKVLVVRAVVKA